MNFRFLADENFNFAIVRGLRLRVPLVDVERVQDMGLDGTADPLLLELAATENRILLTHDIRTMQDFAAERITAAAELPGVIIVPGALSVRMAIDELETICGCSEPHEWRDQIRFIPLHVS